ncbi:unnamed protein product [Sphagnum jensenii]
MPSIFPPVQTAPLVNPDGTGTSQLLLYLNQFLQRTGGITGGTYSTLPVTSGVITWNVSSSPVVVVQLNNGVNTLTITGMVAGAPPYRITFVQPASGAAGTVSYPANFVFPGGVTPILSMANNAVDLFSYVSDGTNMYLMTQGLNYLT